jgi:hypothetical protein
MPSDTKKLSKQDTMAWILVLAIAITLCAMLFFVFAVYLSSINKNLSVTNQRLAIMEENQTQLLNEIIKLRQSTEPKTTH